MEKSERREIRIIDELPDGWFTDRQNSSVWISAYQLVRCERSSIPAPIILDLMHVRAFFLVGTLNYLDSSSIQFDIQPSGNILVTAAPAQRTSPDGIYLLLVTPFSVDGEPSNEALAKSRIDAAVGLIGATYGKAAVFRHVFDNSIDVGSQQVSAISPVFENPGWFAPIDFTTKTPELLQEISTSVLALSDREQNRFALAFRWFRNGLLEIDGSDSFLKFWIAIETLSLPEGDTNVRPANQKLANAYDLPLHEAAGTFGLGRLQGFRSDMIHNGIMKPVHAQLLKYLEALFADLLNAELGRACVGRASAVLAEPGFDLGAYL